MFRLRKTKRIEAAHRLPSHDGKCRRLHGHSYAITVEVEGERLHGSGPKRGMVADYYDIGKIMEQHVDCLDHQDLNELFPNPTSEEIAKALYEGMAPKVAALGARLSRVLVSETQDSVAEYAP